jgi:hypothetical protein
MHRLKEISRINKRSKMNKGESIKKRQIKRPEKKMLKKD